jgi:hypothetical protein
MPATQVPLYSNSTSVGSFSKPSPCPISARAMDALSPRLRGKDIATSPVPLLTGGQTNLARLQPSGASGNKHYPRPSTYPNACFLDPWAPGSQTPLSRGSILPGSTVCTTFGTAPGPRILVSLGHGLAPANLSVSSLSRALLSLLQHPTSNLPPSFISPPTSATLVHDPRQPPTRCRHSLSASVSNKAPPVLPGRSTISPSLMTARRSPRPFSLGAVSR